MREKKETVDLVNGDILTQLMKFVWPIILANFFQRIFNITNEMIVGNLVSGQAMSAVAACTYVNNVVDFIFYGIATACGIVVANSFGANDHEKTHGAIRTGLAMAVVGGLIITCFSELLMPSLLAFSKVKPELYADAERYMRVYMLGNTAVALYHMAFFVLRAMGDSRHPLYYLMTSCGINVVLGYVFVRFFNLGVVGVALATVISQYIVDILALKLMLGMDETYQFKLKEFLKIDLEYAGKILKLGIPAALQNMMLAFSNILIQQYVNSYSVAFVGGVGVANKVANFTQIPMLSISTIGTSFVGVNLGAKKYDRVKQGIKLCNRISLAITAVCALIIFALAEPIMGLFNSDPDIIKYGAIMTRFTVFSYIPLTWSHVYNGCCRGADNMLIPLLINMFCQCIFKYFFVMIGTAMGYGEIMIYLAYLCSSTLAGVAALLYFQLSPWTKKAHLR